VQVSQHNSGLCSVYPVLEILSCFVFYGCHFFLFLPWYSGESDCLATKQTYVMYTYISIHKRLTVCIYNTCIHCIYTSNITAIFHAVTVVQVSTGHWTSSQQHMKHWFPWIVGSNNEESAARQNNVRSCRALWIGQLRFNFWIARIVLNVLWWSQLLFDLLTLAWQKLCKSHVLHI